MRCCQNGRPWSEAPRSRLARCVTGCGPYHACLCARTCILSTPQPLLLHTGASLVISLHALARAPPRSATQRRSIKLCVCGCSGSCSGLPHPRLWYVWPIHVRMCHDSLWFERGGEILCHAAAVRVVACCSSSIMSEANTQHVCTRRTQRTRTQSGARGSKPQCVSCGLNTRGSGLRVRCVSSASHILYNRLSLLMVQPRSLALAHWSRHT